MEKLVNYLQTVSLQFVIIVAIALLCVAGIVYWICKVVKNKKEKKRKENPFVLNLEHAGKLFKVMGLYKENDKIVYLHPDPNKNYPSGKVKEGKWFSSANISKELMKEAQVLKVIKVSDKEIKIVGPPPF